VRRILVTATLLLAVLGPVAATAPAHNEESDKACNVRLKGLKTLSDPQRKLVNLHPKSTTAGNGLCKPSRTLAFCANWAENLAHEISRIRAVTLSP
jgi:hypothetical protein